MLRQELEGGKVVIMSSHKRLTPMNQEVETLLALRRSRTFCEPSHFDTLGSKNGD